MKRVVVVGDALLDRDIDGDVERLCPEAPVPVLDERARLARPGGAGLAAVLAAGDGAEVTLVTALADDPPGRELSLLLRTSGVRVVDVGLAGATPEKVRLRADGRLLLRLDRGAGGPPGPSGAEVAEAIGAADGVLVSDYGRGVAAAPGMRAALAASRAAIVWDPHPRGADPLAGATLVTPNRAEARRLAGDAPEAELADTLRRRWRARAVAVTLGERGAVVADTGGVALVEAPAANGGDPCGAGDRFAAAALGALADGAGAEEAVRRAVGLASAFVAAGGAGSVAAASRTPPASRPLDAAAVVRRVRAGGGTVVATGGCFDLLHAGHVRMLEEARALGDCLVVLLNSDESTRRLKGPDRPLVPQEDRAAVLGALACVDAVVVFDEDAPERALAELRPDIWAKGGDYAADELPEAATLQARGGRVAILPFVTGRSTTRLIEEAALRAGR